MSSLSQYLQNRGFQIVEGHCQEVPGQVEDLIVLTSRPGIKVMEIGFNAGHSAEVFLKNNKDLTLVSFDLGCHDYGKCGKEYIDITYPNRHTLILGDSFVTIPEYLGNNKGNTFDVIFIDGGHSEVAALADLDNCFHLAHENTVVIMDDAIFSQEWQNMYGESEPKKAWMKRVNDQKVIEWKRREYSFAREMAWGVYNKNFSS